MVKCLRLMAASAALLATIPRAPAAPAEDDQGLQPFLRETCYWRQYYVTGLMRISPRGLRKEGEKWLSKTGLRRLRQDTRKYLDGRGIDWEKTDWQDVAVTHFPVGVREAAMKIVPTIYPPEDWTSPEFDDGKWVRQRITPYPYSRSHQGIPHLFIRSVHLRTTFVVPDPSKVKSLTMSLLYRGGIRVFVNGREVVRGHLPEGKLAPDAPGADYPEPAYRAFLDEVPEPNKGRRCVSDIRLPFELSPRPRRGGKRMAPYRNTFSCLLTREGWKRIQPLRDRGLGPVTIPGKLLRKGTNCLAVEIRCSHYHPIILPGAGGGRFYNSNWVPASVGRNETWSHARLIELSLTDPGGHVPSAMSRPEGVQVWAEDMHTRCYPQDYLQAGRSVGRVRMVGGLNGTYSGQVVVGTSRELTGLQATAGDLTPAGGGGKPIPASAAEVRYMVPERLSDLWKAGCGRVGCAVMNHFARDTTLYLSNNRALLEPASAQALRKEMEKLYYFDHLTARAPKRVPPGTCQPIFLTVRVPEDVAAGAYRGRVRVQAKGVPPAEVPVELEVLPWRVPDPLDFQTDMLLDESPYGVHKHYKDRVKLWSDEHFKLLDSSFALLRRVGSDLVYIPILRRMEFGNHEDCMVRWIRRKDGSLDFDYTVMDRYLDVAIKHLGKPAVVSVALMQCMMASSGPAVTVYDEATGKHEKLDLNWRTNPIDRLPIWRQFATDIVAHLRARGLGESIYWGHPWDHEPDPGLLALLNDLFPEIYWTAATHSYHGGAGGGGHDPAMFKTVCEYYTTWRPTSSKGWLAKQQRSAEKWHNTNSPRGEADGINLPFTFRSITDRSLRLGFTGIGRMAFDYFDGAWMDGHRGMDWLPAGMPCHSMSYPGPDRVESSARFEAMIEGVQDAELRCFLEQCIHRDVLPDDLAEQARRALLDRHRSHLCNRFRDSQLAVMTYDWLGNSRRVYEVAAKVARTLGLDVSVVETGGKVPALGRSSVSLKVRNWTGKPRAWKAAADAEWIVPSRGEGSTVGQDELVVALNGSGLKAGQELTGALTVTDVASGRAWPVKVTARVTPAMEALCVHPHFNVPVGGSDSREFRIVNHTAKEQPWKLTASAGWIKVAPGAGRLKPGQDTFVTVTASPKDKQAARHEATLTFTGADGAVTKTIRSRTFVVPLYRDPGELPFGRVIKAATVDKKHIRRHKCLAVGDHVISGRRQKSGERYPRFGFQSRVGLPILGKKRFNRAMWVQPAHETVYALEGTGFTAYSAWVGVPVGAAKQKIRQHDRRISFEIYVDGKLRTQSGMMTSTDRGRLLVVRDLADAKELRLVTRMDSCGDNSNFVAAWANPQFYQEP